MTALVLVLAARNAPKLRSPAPPLRLRPVCFPWQLFCGVRAVETPRGARGVQISSHYDLGNDLFGLMLDERMVYSCGLFPTASTGHSLEDAQVAKLDAYLRQARPLTPYDHLLEISGPAGVRWPSTPRRPPRLPRDHDDDLARAGVSWRGRACARPGSPTARRSCCVDYRELEGR